VRPCASCEATVKDFMPPLEVVDFVVGSKGQKQIPDSARGGEQMAEEY
jgi:hypothetical protein